MPPRGPIDVACEPDVATTVRMVLARHADEAGSLLPILHDVQDALGYVPAPVVPQIAAALNLSRAEVHGVLTYYHYFRREPAARHVVQVCRAEACQSMGADALMAHAQRSLGDAGAEFTVEPVFCLGLCATSPAVCVDQRLHARMTPAKFDAVIAGLRSGN